MSKHVMEYLDRMAASTELAFVLASAAYIFDFLKWLFCLSDTPVGYGHCVNPFLDAITGLIHWMGGPVDIGFYTFIASEGGRYMILAAIEKRRMRREWEAELEKEREARIEEREARIEEREASEKRIAELIRELEEARKDDHAV